VLAVDASGAAAIKGERMTEVQFSLRIPREAIMQVIIIVVVVVGAGGWLV
jgi:hypothetical protein